MTDRDHVAAGLATAMLAGPWEREPMRRRCRAALGVRAAPKWLDTLVEKTLEAYRDAPRDRPREFAAYLQTRPAWLLAWQRRRRPRIVEWTPVPTAVTARPWPVDVLPHLGALARVLDLDQGELAWFADVRGLERTVAEPLRHYRWSTRPRPDGVRVLAAPKPRMKEIQRRLLRHVLASIPTHPAAHGGVAGRSVRTALLPHADATVVVRVDLAGFFGSIAPGRVWALLRTAGLPEQVAHTVTGLVTTVVPAQVRAGIPHDVPRGPHLPQGAPTSPALANLVTFTLDRRLDGLATRFGARYTRYVDDLIFSGGPSLRTARSRFVALVEDVVRSEGFRTNDRKTVVLGASGRQALLGGVVNHHPTLDRPQRDALRALLHNCRVHGWRSQVREQENLREHVLGRISWAGSLDPAFGARLRAAYDAVDWS